MIEFIYLLLGLLLLGTIITPICMGWKKRKKRREMLEGLGISRSYDWTLRGFAFRFQARRMSDDEIRGCFVGRLPDDMQDVFAVNYGGSDWPAFYIEALVSANKMLNYQLSQRLLEERPNASDWGDLEEIKAFLRHSQLRDSLGAIMGAAISSFTYKSDESSARAIIEILLSIAVHCSRDFKTWSIVTLTGASAYLPITKEDVEMLQKSVRDMVVAPLLASLASKLGGEPIRSLEEWRSPFEQSIEG